MMTKAVVSAGADDLAPRLARDSFIRVPGDAVVQLVGTPREAWDEFLAEWERLALDPYMGDGGRYRFRRYGALLVEDDQFVVEPHGPYRQELDDNPLNGGIDRLFEPLTETFLSCSVLSGLVRRMVELVRGNQPCDRWRVTLHPYRIVAEVAALGHPAPEGRHRDGVDYIASMMIRRRNVSGGVSTLYGHDGRLLAETCLEHMGDLLLSDDRATLHAVTPVAPVDPGLAAYRDVLVFGLTAMPRRR